MKRTITVEVEADDATDLAKLYKAMADWVADAVVCSDWSADYDCPGAAVSVYTDEEDRC